MLQALALCKPSPQLKKPTAYVGINTTCNFIIKGFSDFIPLGNIFSVMIEISLCSWWCYIRSSNTRNLKAIWLIPKKLASLSKVLTARPKKISSVFMFILPIILK